MGFDDLELAQLRTRTGEKWQHYGPDVLAAWVADMDFEPAEPIRRALAGMVERSDVGYPLNPRPNGLPSLICDWVASHHGLVTEPRRVEVITDVVQALYVGLDVFSEPGEGVVIQNPIYPPFLVSARETKRRAVLNPLVRGPDRYEVDLDHLRAAIDADTRIFMLCNPHNPTGSVYTRAELEAIAEIAIANDLIVLADEIHADLVFSNATHIPIATLGPEIAARTITLMSATKTFNIAGLRCAFAIFGSAELKRRFNSIPRHVRGGLGAPGLMATRVAFEQCEPWRQEMLVYLEANRDFAHGFLANEVPALRFLPPEATYLAWLDCRELDLGDDPFQFFLDKAGVAFSDGRTFGEGGEGFVRLNFATSRHILAEILERVAKAV